MTPADLPDWADEHPRKLLDRRGLRAQRHLGQNFLVGRTNLDRVVNAADVQPDEAVLEIGTGMGRLTARLALRAEHVVTVEIDPPSAAAAAQHLAGFPNVTTLCCDFLERKHKINPRVTDAVAPVQQATGRPLRVVANLPYSISSPAIINLLEWRVPVGDMVLMVQKEVAERLDAAPGTSEYGPLTIYARYWAEVSRVFNLGKNTFWPAPQVASALVRVTRTRTRDEAENYETFVAVTRRLMTLRRKTLRKALKSGWGARVADQTIGELGLDRRARPEDLSVEHFERLARHVGRPE
jgi:16S rRNA (adenine1518-N6/adenine1519-N6)-dimethyltransferase